jgi:hypothetical protein
MSNILIIIIALSSYHGKQCDAIADSLAQLAVDEAVNSYNPMDTGNPHNVDTDLYMIRSFRMRCKQRKYK